MLHSLEYRDPLVLCAHPALRKPSVITKKEYAKYVQELWSDWKACDGCKALLTQISGEAYIRSDNWENIDAFKERTIRPYWQVDTPSGNYALLCEGCIDKCKVE